MAPGQDGQITQTHTHGKKKRKKPQRTALTFLTLLSYALNDDSGETSYATDGK